MFPETGKSFSGLNT